ncbi:zinc finger, C3HC4 type domain-containing protein [Cryptosporidium muris RN66]|uniref:Zinc finger, C3HC4 type domain-containing protein n=1 Tax=Cryptosporidium muris (strain RN66) TaxID=441375 RepID=B6AAA9_CRYMR|nr:zinc finger, C3HC4 type domain-containing protein [Cryptosporidium muris RN66]EEA05150.1 zinc finger, C3HC4 type domain-containing protein [Cryptosporidium muris RN66]|eukprot:XP_002139499.1 zinc finger, C3HC4 type domain-containing protein [Cryptosporidium muris RN66]
MSSLFIVGIRESSNWRRVSEYVGHVASKCIMVLMQQYYFLKWLVKILIILIFTLLPLINEMNSIVPLLSVFVRDTDWLLVPSIYNKGKINNDLLIRVNSWEFIALSSFTSENEQKGFYNNGYNVPKHDIKEFIRKRKHKSKVTDSLSSSDIKPLYEIKDEFLIDNSKIITRNSRQYQIYMTNLQNNNHTQMIGDTNGNILKYKYKKYTKEQVSICINYSLLSLHKIFNMKCPINNKRNYKNKNLNLQPKVNFINVPNSWCSLYTHKDNNNGQYFFTFILPELYYKYKPSYIFKVTTLIFVVFRWCILLFRMVMQVLPNQDNNTYTNERYSDIARSQLIFYNQCKSLLSFSTFYIWSLSSVYLLYGLTPNRCTHVPRIALHESVQWILWISLVTSCLSFQFAKINKIRQGRQEYNSDRYIGESHTNDTVEIIHTSQTTNGQSTTQKILGHALIILACCGFGFSLSGSVMLLTTQMTSPWINSNLVTIICQCCDLLLRAYLGLLHNSINCETKERSINCYKYIFPYYLLREEEKINCNGDGKREWIVKSISNPPPLIFRHSFISIKLQKLSPTFYMQSCFENNITLSNKGREYCNINTLPLESKVEDLKENEERSKNNSYDRENTYLMKKLSSEDSKLVIYPELSEKTDDNSPCSSSSSNYSLSDEISICMICYDRVSNIVLSPCYHSGICSNCIDEIIKWTVCKLKKSPQCHLCRCPIEIAWQLDNNRDLRNDEKESGNYSTEEYISQTCIEVIYPILIQRN